jgi:radical SAM superfamily enzyme YgiQ (UPF0313 family)
MKIGLISPKVNFSTKIKALQEFWYKSTDASPYRNYWSGIGSGLLTVAALTPSSHQIEFIDENIEPIDFSKSYDLVGITAMTQQSARAYAIADEFRKRRCIVVIGGIHATLLPEEAKTHADSVVVGEAESEWPKVLDDVLNNNLNPYYYSKNSAPMTSSPVPRFDLCKKYNYGLIWIQMSRGCPHDCEYCTASKIFGKKLRNKSLQQVLAEIALVRDVFPDSRIAFADDNLLVNKTILPQLLSELPKFNMRWHAQCDISIGKDDKLLDLLRKSGCTFLFIGLESLSNEGLNSIDKNGWKADQLKNYSTYIQNIQSRGIGVMGAFMIGLDSDDLTTFKRVENFIVENNLYAASITILTPLPGTRLRKRYEKENRLLPTTWEDHTGYNANHIPKLMKIDELESGLAGLYERIYRKDVYESKMVYFKKIQKEMILKGTI